MGTPEPSVPVAAPAVPAPAASADRLFHALRGLSVFAVVVGVGGHDLDALIAATPEHVAVAAPVAAWAYAAAHLVAAIAGLALGYLAISLAYPLRGLARRAHANPAAAIQASAHLLGAAVLATVAWGGCDAPSLAVSATFSGLGWAAVIAICAAHRLVTRYRDHEEIAAGNTAAAISAAGLHLAVAIVVARAIQGEFLGWGDSLRGFVFALVWVIALYPLRQVVLARLILGIGPRAMDAAISTRHDHYIAAAEGVFYVVAALCLSAGW
jgi:uncharacterized membrane protein YjfL (UPF0719 family)